eukprot:scaffold195913_cov28-Tisochrysis_lutea.AAC.1
MLSTEWSPVAPKPGEIGAAVDGSANGAMAKTANGSSPSPASTTGASPLAEMELWPLGSPVPDAHAPSDCAPACKTWSCGSATISCKR